MKNFIYEVIEDYKNTLPRVKDGPLMNIVTIFVYLMPLLGIGGILYFVISFFI